MFQKYFIISLVLFANFVNAQKPNSSNYSKIKFVYESVPNFTFGEKGITGSLALLEKEFPDIKPEVIEDKKSVGTAFILYSQLTENDKTNLKAFMVHHAERIVGEYDKATNSTKIDVFRSGTKAHDQVAKYLKISGNGMDSEGNLDYAQKILTHGNLHYNYSKKFDEMSFDVAFTSKKSGNYYYKNADKTKCVAEFNEDLPVYVTPNILFSNSTAGVNELSNIYSTVKLISVDYE